MQRSARYALIAVVAIVVLGTLAFWFFVLRSTAPERAALPDRPAAEATDTTAVATDATTDDATTDATADDADASPEGVWTLEPGSAGFVGYRIDELFAGDTIKVTAVGRTPAVTGTLTIDGTTITEAEVEADLSQMVSDSERRDNYIRTRSLETDNFPEARFVLTEPVDLGVLPSPGEEVTFVASGDLTLRGATQPVEVAMQARWNGDSIDVAGGAPVALADFGIEVISIPFVTIDDAGEFEMQLAFTR